MQIRFITLITALAFLHIGSEAKKKAEYPRADIKISYNYHEKFLRGNTDLAERDIPMILLANDSGSKFFCPDTEYKDSLESTPSGRAKSKQMLHAAIMENIRTKDESALNAFSYKTFMYVFKNFEEKISTVYDKVGMGESGVYSEAFSEIKWEPGDSVKTVLGYDCVIATTDYHGRRWTAWFAPEIPVHDGPWKLQGLPGLILEAYEQSGQHHFIADGIEKSAQPIVPVYNRDAYDTMSRMDMLKGLRNYRDNGNSMAKAALGLDLGDDAPAQTIYDFLETDYR